MKLEYEREYLLTPEILENIRLGDVLVVEGKLGVVYVADMINGLKCICENGSGFSFEPASIEGLQIVIKANHAPVWNQGQIWEFFLGGSTR